MNQILEFDTDNKKNHKSGGSGSTSDKAVRVFAILLMVFAVALIGSGVYSIVKNNTEEKEENVIPEAQEVNITIDAVLDEEEGEVTINVESEYEISKVVYTWNSDTEKTIAGDGKTSIEKVIDAPVGTNTLYIKVIDINNQEESESFEFTAESGDDIINPNIEISQSGAKLIITATDETEIDYLTYRWNDDPETRVNVDDDENISDTGDNKTIVIEIDILEGKNDITVIAVDASSKHNSEIQTTTINGVTLPEISYDTYNNDDGDFVITFTCTHEDGIEYIYYELNGAPFETTLEEPMTSVPFDVVLKPGENNIKLTVTSASGITTNEEFECDF